MDHSLLMFVQELLETLFSDGLLWTVASSVSFVVASITNEWMEDTNWTLFAIDDDVVFLHDALHCIDRLKVDSDLSGWLSIILIESSDRVDTRCLFAQVNEELCFGELRWDFRDQDWLGELDGRGRGGL